MKLRKTYKTEAEIPDGAKGLYEKKNGAWSRREDLELEVDDMGEIDGDSDEDSPKPDRRLDEFRNTNKKVVRENNELKAELGRLKKQFEGMNPEQVKKYQAMIEKQQGEEEKTLLAEGKVDELVQRRIRRVVEEKDAEIRQRTTAYQEIEGKYKTMADRLAANEARRQLQRLIDGKAMRVRQGASEDLDRAVLADWTADEEGKLVLRNQDLTGKDGGPMTPQEYVDKELVARRSYFFEPAKGGGAKGNTGGGSGDDGGGGGETGRIKRDPMAVARNAKAIAAGEARLEKKPGRNF